MMKNIYTIVLLFAFTGAFSQVEGTWMMANQAAALGVGPTLGDISWWSNSVDDLTTRACYFDDKFVFDASGSFNNVMDGETWLEQWQSGSPDACGVPVAPHDGSNTATWDYNAGTGELMLTGVGAHIGLPKVINGAEITDPASAPASITYPVIFSADGDTMYVDIDFGGGYWHYVLVKTGTASVLDIEEDMFNFYPNPAGSQIQIQSIQQIDEITIRDITGKAIVVKTNPSSTETIDVSELSRGIYLLESRSGKKRLIKKLMLK